MVILLVILHYSLTGNKFQTKAHILEELDGWTICF